MTQGVYLPKEYDIFIGIDVDKKSYSYTVKDQDIMRRSKKIPSDPEHLTYYIKKNYSGKRIICAYEAGPTGYYLYDHLMKEGIKCIVTPACTIPKAANDRVKTNRIDSERISEYLKGGQLKSVRVPMGEYRELRYLVKSRQDSIKQIVIAKQRIKALLLSAYLYPHMKEVTEKWSNKYIEKLKTIPCSYSERQRLDMLLKDLSNGREQKLVIYKILKKYINEHKEIKEYIEYLRTIPGIGFSIAATILAKIGDPRHLNNARQIAAFAGLVPVEYSTGETIKKGPISHTGDRVLRTLLIEGAWIAIRKDIRLRQFYFRIKSKNYTKAGSKKAIVGVARKMTQIVYRILTERRDYNK